MAELGRDGEELGKWQDRLRHDPRDPQAHRAIGSLLFRDGSLDEAEQSLSRALSLNPDDPSTLAMLARIAERRKQPDEALRYWTEVNRVRPQDPAAAFKVARAWLGRDEPARAVDIIKIGLSANPDDARLLFLAARASQAAGRLTQALGQWEELTGVSDYRFEAHHARGRILLGFGRTESAAVEFTKALAVRSDQGTEDLLRKCSAPPFEGLLATSGVPRIRVSVVVAAHNAAAYLPDAVESLLGQTYPHWEAIIVDDSSMDETPEIAAAYVRRDRRIRTLAVSAGSVSTARNAGLAEASCDWVLFLDADDWMLPGGLQHLVTVLGAEPRLDGIYGEAMRVATDGRILSNRQRPVDPAEFFQQTVIGHCIPIHTCIVRRSLIEGAGGFDASFAVGEDWDLWLRLGRLGARFAAIRHPVCCYRLRSDSSSFDIRRGIEDGIRILRHTHGPDGRISAPQRYPDGAPLHGLPGAEAELVRDVATVAVYQSSELEPLLDYVSPESLAMIRSTGFISRSLAERSSDRQTSRSPDYWETIVARAGSFFEAIERRTGISGLARAAMRRHRREVCHLLDRGEPVGFGDSYGIRVDVGGAIEDHPVPAGTEYVELGVIWQGSLIDRLTLHPCGQVVSAQLIRQAVARHAHWKLLGHLFAATCYDRMKSGPQRGGSLWLDGACVGSGVGFQLDMSAPALHAKVGLQVFLDQLWRVGGGTAAVQASSDNRLVLDAAEELTDAEVDAGAPVRIRMAIAGDTVRRFSIDPRDRIIRAEQLRRIMQGATTLSAMQIAVERAICGIAVPLATSLAERLKRAAVQPGDGGSAPDDESAPYERLRGLDDPQPRPNARFQFERVFSHRENPWSYDSPYEQLKYEQTVSMLPQMENGSALELACAEGHFTGQLACRVGRVLAADISTVALSRARQRCLWPNVEFRQLDFLREPLPGQFDVIVCSEVLYYASSTDELTSFATRIRDALRPDGALIMAHANCLGDDADEPGFDWQVPFGAKRIGEVFSDVLVMDRELVSKFYRIQRFRPPGSKAAVLRTRAPAHRPLPRIAVKFSEHGGAPSAISEPVTARRPTLPILCYHSISPPGSGPINWRTTPEQFDEQLEYLQSAGYRSIGFAEWAAAGLQGQGVPEQSIIITFDDGFTDFAEHAWPLLKKHGFGATAFVVTGLVGGVAEWNRGIGDPAPLLSWAAIRELAEDGVEFGSHSVDHPYLTGLSQTEARNQLAESRKTLEDRLGKAVDCLAYPYGDASTALQDVAHDAGYSFAVTTERHLATPISQPLALPRLSIKGSDDITQFIKQLT